ncbi:MAG: hypothetical protein JWP91_243 [Fibrobacteres bacterium]|nr:hypothetical protein [Fibrobacterota bacterium]
MHGLDEVMRLKRVHKRWARLNALLGVFPVFAVINRFQPMLTDGYGGDLIPSLLPEALAGRYNMILAAALAVLVASEVMRRRFHARHKEDLAL